MKKHDESFGGKVIPLYFNWFECRRKRRKRREEREIEKGEIEKEAILYILS